jgi:hypothetical protein
MRINLPMTSHNVWDMSLFEHIFQGLSLYLEAMNRFPIRNKEKGRIWIWIRINVASRIQIQILIKMKVGSRSASGSASK